MSFLTHSAFTTPGVHASAVAGFPSDLRSITDTVQGLFVHSDYLSLYGFDEGDFANVSRDTLPLKERLEQILAVSNAPLSEPRATNQRSIGTCRDYAVMMCGFLREHSTPARVRCGFATYFTPDHYEDHWVVECWNANEEQWIRADAQMDEQHQAYLNIDFDPINVPNDRFFTAQEAWHLVQTQSVSPELFGHGDDSGLWFLRVNLARDTLSLHGEETSLWDNWREARAFSTETEAHHWAACEMLASCTTRNGQVPQPYWLEHAAT